LIRREDLCGLTENAGGFSLIDRVAPRPTNMRWHSWFVKRV